MEPPCPRRSACSPNSPTAVRSGVLIVRILWRSKSVPRADELDTATWARVFREAAALGVLQVHLSGGEPAARRDLPEIVQAAREAGLYNNLITSAVGLTPQNLATLSAAGLDHVQISIQDSDAASADHIAGYKGAFARKRELAKEVVNIDRKSVV